jgi:hypothetical protein
MKTLRGIDEKPMHVDDEMPQDRIDKIPTYRRMMRDAVSLGMAKSGAQAIDLVQIGLKLKQVENEISLEDAEFKMLYDRCDLNPCQWQVFYHGQLMLKLKEVEK